MSKDLSGTVEDVEEVMGQESVAISKKEETPVADRVENMYAPMITAIRSHEVECKAILAKPISAENCKESREKRLALVKIRGQIEAKRKATKEYINAEGKRIDGGANTWKASSMSLESPLQAREDHYKNIEKEKILKIASERLTQLKEYGMEECSLDLGIMENNIWESFLFGAKAKFEAIKEEEEALRKATEEAERVKALETQRRIALSPFADYVADFHSAYFALMTEEDFNLLKSDAEAKKKKADADAEALKKENARLKKEADIRDAELAEERRIAKEKEDARLETEKAERLESERLEAEIAEKEKADREAEKKKLSAPDKEKLLAFALEVKNMEFPSLKTEEAKQILSGAIESINNASAKIEQEAIKL